MLEVEWGSLIMRSAVHAELVNILWESHVNYGIEVIVFPETDRPSGNSGETDVAVRTFNFAKLISPNQACFFLKLVFCG